MTLPLISAAAAGAILILQLMLMVAVGLHRTKSGVFVGLEGDRDLERKARRHGNLAENAGIFIVALALAEIIGAPSGFVMTIALVFVIGRALHAIGFSSLTGSHGDAGNRFFVAARAIGAFSTFFGGLALGAMLLYLVL
ncbi:MAG: MAPEG family protein [Pseudomonadota bacterium]